MPSEFPTGRPAGIGRARPRLTDKETERRMLETAARALSRTGLTVSLDHIRLEDVIREAGVSRSTAYRRWPSKDQFLGDLLLELAHASKPMATTGTAEASAAIRDVLLAHLDLLGEDGGRQRLAAEVIRQTAPLDLRRILAAPEWHTYLALTATASSLPAGELRDRVRAALAESEQTFTAGIAHSHRVVAGLLGLRQREGSSLTFEVLAHLVNATMRGFVIKAMVSPGLADQTVPGPLHGVAGPWSLPAAGMADVVLSHVEPDPGVVWDRTALDGLRDRLRRGGDLLAGDH